MVLDVFDARWRLTGIRLQFQSLIPFITRDIELAMDACLAVFRGLPKPSSPLERMHRPPEGLISNPKVRFIDQCREMMRFEGAGYEAFEERFPAPLRGARSWCRQTGGGARRLACPRLLSLAPPGQRQLCGHLDSLETQ